MKIRAYGLKNGDLFEWKGEIYKVTQQSATSHVRASNKTGEIMLASQTIVEVTGSVLPSRNSDIGIALDLEENES